MALNSISMLQLFSPNRHITRSLSGLSLAAAGLSLLIGAPMLAQQDAPAAPGRQFPVLARDPAESSAYSAAIALTDPEMKSAALRSFLRMYPNSNLRQPAMAQLMNALRETRGMGPNPAAGEPQPAPKPDAAVPPPAAVAQPAAPAYTGTRDSLLTQAPKAPEVTLGANRLTVKADNCTLSQILSEISHKSGMKIDGMSNDQRVFGSYGPGEPREVLSALLDGSGYNVVMVGSTPDGAPRQLSLTQRTQGAVSGAPNQQQPSPDAEGPDDPDDEIQQTPPEPPIPQPISRPIPQNGQPNDGSQPQQPRTPQQIIQELQRMRQQQEQNQPQPQQ